MNFFVTLLIYAVNFFVTLYRLHKNKPCEQNSALFCFPPTTKIFENNFPSKLQTILIKSKTFFHNRKLTSIRVVFRLNKTLFTHFHYDYVRIKCLLMTQNRKLLISSSKLRNYIGKKCEQSLYLNPKLSP